VSDLAGLLRRLEDAKEELLSSLDGLGPEEFGWQRDSRSIRRAVEETVDRFNLYFSRYLARALGLPPPPCLAPAQPGPARAAAQAAQIAPRRLGNRLPPLWARLRASTLALEGEGTVGLAALLERAVEQYRRCRDEVLTLRRAREEASGSP